MRAQVDFKASGWVCARRMDDKGHQTHTGAVFVKIAGAPVRAGAGDAEYFAQFIDSLIRKTSPGGPWNRYFAHDLAAVQMRYAEARKVFERIAGEARHR